MTKWIITAALLAALTGCGPSAYEKAQAKLTAAQSTKEQAQEGLDVLSKYRYSELDPEGQRAFDGFKEIIKQADQEIMEATAELRKLGS